MEAFIKEVSVMAGRCLGAGIRGSHPTYAIGAAFLSCLL